MHEPKWMTLAKGEIGTKEGHGPRDNPKVLKYYGEAGHGWVKHDSVAWCAAFANAMLSRAGEPGTSSLAARSFLQWGKKLKAPKYGCVTVFKRGRSSWQGHVGFYVRTVGNTIEVVGGNQRDAVNIRRYPKSKLLGYRWPVTATNSRTALGAAVGLLSVPADYGSQVMEASSFLQPYQGMSAYLDYLAMALAVGGIGIVLYARWDDWRQKGR